MTEHRALSTSPVETKLTIGDFEILARAGAFEENGRTELIDGRIYVVNSEFRPHAYAKTDLGFLVRDALKDTGLRIVIDASVAIAPVNMPEPDIVLTDAALEDSAIPIESCRLIIEVAQTSLPMDAGKKARIYAAAGVAEYWIVDLKGREVRILTGPHARGYGSDERVPFGARLVSRTVAGLAVETAALA